MGILTRSLTRWQEMQGTFTGGDEEPILAQCESRSCEREDKHYSGLRQGRSWLVRSPSTRQRGRPMPPMSQFPFPLHRYSGFLTALILLPFLFTHHTPHPLAFQVHCLSLPHHHVQEQPCHLQEAHKARALLLVSRHRAISIKAETVSPGLTLL